MYSKCLSSQIHTYRSRIMCTVSGVCRIIFPPFPPSETNPVWTATVLELLVTKNNSFKTKNIYIKLHLKCRKVSVLSVEFTFVEEFLGIHQFYLTTILFSVKPLLSLKISPHQKKTMFLKALMDESRDWGLRNTLSFHGGIGRTQ